MQTVKRLFPLLLALCLLTGCGQAEYITPLREEEPVYIDQMVIKDIDLEYETMALSTSSAAQNTLLLPVASGDSTKSSSRAVVDYSNTKDGYVMVRFTGATSKRLRVQVKGPSTTYTYDLPVGAWTTYPLSDGNGNYQVTVLENTTKSQGAGRQPLRPPGQGGGHLSFRNQQRDL